MAICLLSGTLAFRHWCARRAFKILHAEPALAADRPGAFHAAALWSYAWRSFAALVLASAFLGVALGETPEAGGRLVGIGIGIWAICSVFVLDVPFWVRKRPRSAQPQKGDASIDPQVSIALGPNAALAISSSTAAPTYPPSIPPTPPEPVIGPTPPPIDETPEVYVSAGGIQKGPFTERQIKDLRESGALPSTARYWHVGMEKWEPLKDHFAQLESFHRLEPNFATPQREPSPLLDPNKPTEPAQAVHANQNLPATVLNLREKAGLTQEELAKKAGLAPVYVRLAEQGRKMDDTALLKLSNALEVPSETFRDELQAPTSGSDRREPEPVAQAQTKPPEPLEECDPAADGWQADSKIAALIVLLLLALAVVVWLL